MRRFPYTNHRLLHSAQKLCLPRCIPNIVCTRSYYCWLELCIEIKTDWSQPLICQCHILSQPYWLHSCPRKTIWRPYIFSKFDNMVHKSMIMFKAFCSKGKNFPIFCSVEWNLVIFIFTSQNENSLFVYYSILTLVPLLDSHYYY